MKREAEKGGSCGQEKSTKPSGRHKVRGARGQREAAGREGLRLRDEGVALEMYLSHPPF